MKKVGSLIRGFEDWVSGLLIVSGLGVMLLQVVTRYILGYPTTWHDEISRYLIVWGVLIGSAVAIRDNEHIKVDILYQYLSPRIKNYINIFVYLISLAFFIYLFVYGWQLVEKKMITEQLSYSGFKLWIIYSILPLSGFLMSMRTVIQLIQLKDEDNKESEKIKG